MLRDKARLRIEDAAKQLECSTAKVSRLENGKGVPYARDVRDLAELYGAGSERLGDLLSLVEDGRAQDWYSTFRDVLQGEMSADHVNRFIELERDADGIKTFQAELIPGLLQTKRYIEAVCATIFPEKTQRERDRFVHFRLERQRLLRRAEPPQVDMIVHELAIVKRFGGEMWRDVMRDQLEHLIVQLSGPLKEIVDFRLVPLTSQARGALGGPFVILKFAANEYQDLVYLEGREGAHWLETDGDVVRYEQMFSGLELDSLSREESLERLSSAVVGLAQEVEQQA